MFYTKIRLVGLSSVDFPIIGASPSDEYVLKNVEGLGPPEVNVNITNTLYEEGAFQSALPVLRQVVMRIGLNPNYTAGRNAGDLRTALYWLMEPKFTQGITIQIMNGSNVLVQAKGWVSKFEVVPFSKDPQIQVTFNTNNTFLQAPASIVAPGNNVYKYSAWIFSQGSARVPFIARARVAANTGSISLRRLISDDGGGLTQEFLLLDSYGFVVNDVINIDSRPGSRNVTITRNGVTTSILGWVHPASEWPWMDPIVLNEVRMSGNASLADMVLENVTYTPRYWGV